MPFAYVVIALRHIVSDTELVWTSGHILTLLATRNHVSWRVGPFLVHQIAAENISGVRRGLKTTSSLSINNASAKTTSFSSTRICWLRQNLTAYRRSQGLVHLAAIMNVLLSPQPSLFPHHHNAARHNSAPRRLSDFFLVTTDDTDGWIYGTDNSQYNIQYNMSGSNKRKATDDLDSLRASIQDGMLDDVSMSPSPSPAISSRSLARPMKRIRGNELTGRPLALPRLLETLDAQSLRNVLQSICDRHPQIGAEVVASAPRPSVSSALEVLTQYQTKLSAAFPFGGGLNDYAYNRVRASLSALIDALTDFTPHYLPPNETHVTNSLEFLDGATKVIHDLPDWESYSHKYHKDNAYDEISKAWALVISEASKRGGGFQLHNGEWDHKVAKHNEQSGGKMQAAVNALGTNLSWMGGAPTVDAAQRERELIRNELLSGTYGQGMPVHVGPW